MLSLCFKLQVLATEVIDKTSGPGGRCVGPCTSSGNRLFDNHYHLPKNNNICEGILLVNLFLIARTFLRKIIDKSFAQTRGFSLERNSKRENRMTAPSPGQNQRNRTMKLKPHSRIFLPAPGTFSKISFVASRRNIPKRSQYISFFLTVNRILEKVMYLILMRAEDSSRLRPPTLVNLSLTKVSPVSMMLLRSCDSTLILPPYMLPRCDNLLENRTPPLLHIIRKA